MCSECEINPSAKKNSLSEHYGCENGGQEDCGSCKNPYFWNLCDFCFDKDQEEEDIDDITCDCCGFINKDKFKLHEKYGVLKLPAIDICNCVECVECCELFAIDDIHQDKYDDYYCESCFRDKYIVCDCCMEDFNKEEDDCVGVTLCQEDDNKVTKFVTKNEWCFDCFKEEEKTYGLTNGKKGEYVKYWYGGNLSKEDLEKYQKHCVPLSKDAPNCEECGENWHNVAEYWLGEERSEKWLICGECGEKDSTYQKC